MASVEELRDKLNKLNDYINSLKVWDSYAESLQSDYDRLMIEYNNKLKETEC